MQYAEQTTYDIISKKMLHKFKQQIMLQMHIYVHMFGEMLTDPSKGE